MAGLGRRKGILAAAVLAAIVAAAVLAWATGLGALLSDQNRLTELVEGFGAWGLVLVVAIMATAVVVSPLPSAPIAVAAGAAYGDLWGTLAVVIGAEIGSIVAFSLARWLAADLVRRWVPKGGFFDKLAEPRSQTWLMVIVFVSRLVPFLSFDAVSYAAGLSPLAFWRFALATLVGVVPISFLLAYAGAAFLDSGSTLTIVVLVVLALTSAAPFAIGIVRRVAGRHS